MDPPGSSKAAPPGENCLPARVPSVPAAGPWHPADWGGLTVQPRAVTRLPRGGEVSSPGVLRCGDCVRWHLSAAQPSAQAWWALLQTPMRTRACDTHADPRRPCVARLPQADRGSSGDREPEHARQAGQDHDPRTVRPTPTSSSSFPVALTRSLAPGAGSVPGGVGAAVLFEGDSPFWGAAPAGPGRVGSTRGRAGRPWGRLGSWGRASLCMRLAGSPGQTGAGHQPASASCDAWLSDNCGREGP